MHKFLLFILFFLLLSPANGEEAVHEKARQREKADAKEKERIAREAEEKPLTTKEGIEQQKAKEAEAIGYRIRGVQAQYQGKLDEATILYRKAIATYPDYAAPYNDLGVIFEEQGKLELAEKSYLQALRIDPHYVDAYSNLASLYEKKDQREKMIEVLKKRVTLGKPDDIGTQEARAKLESLGILVEVMPPPPPPVRLVRRPSPPTPAPPPPKEVAPPEPEIKVPEKEIEEVKKEAPEKEAEEALLKRERDPFANAIFLRNEGLKRQRSGNLDEAIRYYRAAIEENPDFVTPYNDLGIALEEKGFLESAERQYRNALSVNPNYEHALYNLALLYEKEGKREEAVRHLETFVQRARVGTEWHREAREKLSFLQAKIREKEEALRRERELERRVTEEKEKRLKEKEERLAQLFDQGKRAFQKKEYAIAQDFFEKMLLIDPEHSLAKSYVKKAQDQIEWERERLLETHRREEERKRQEAEAKRRKEEETLALRHEVQEQLKKEQEREKRERLTHLFKEGKRAYRKKDYSKAEEFFAKMLIVEPENRVGKSYLQKTHDRIQEARRREEEARRIEEERRQKEQQARRQEEERKRKELEEAKRRKEQEEKEREAQERQQRLAQLFDQGKRAFQKKEYAIAQDFFEKTLLVDPEHSLAKSYIAKIQEGIEEEKEALKEAERQEEERKRREAEEARRMKEREEKERLAREREERLAQLLKQGKEAYQRKEYTNAEDLFEKMLLIDPQSRLGTSYLQKTRDRIQEARQREEALKRKEEERRKKEEEARRLEEERKRQEAEEATRREEERKAQEAALYDGAKELYRQGELQKSLLRFEEILVSNPDHPYAGRYIERIKEKQAEQEEARKARETEERERLAKAREEERVRREQIASHLTKGERLLREGTYEEASRALQAVLSLEPNHPQAIRLLEKSLSFLQKERERKQLAKAEKKRERLKEIDKRREALAEDYYREGSRAWKKGETDKAIYAYEKSLFYNKDHERARKALLYAREKQAEEEAKRWRAEQERAYRKEFTGLEAERLYERAKAAFDAKNYTLSQNTLEYLLLLDPKHPFARGDLEEIEAKIREERQEAALAKATLKKEKENALFRTRPKRTEETFERAQQTSEAAEARSRVYPQKGIVPFDEEGAELETRPSMEKAALSYYQEGYHLQHQGEIEDAISHYQKAMAIRPSPGAANGLGILYERKRWYVQAEDAYKKALSLDPHYLAAHTNLALLYERLERSREAKRHWKIRAERGEPGDYWTQKARTFLDASLIKKRP